MVANIQVGVVTGAEVKENRDSEDKSLMLQCEMSQETDMQTVELYTQAGEDYNPPVDSTVIVVQAGSAWKIAIASEDGIESEAEEGERVLYSSDGGSKQATIYLKKDGVIQMNGGTDFAVAFERLKTQFNQLQADYDNLVSLYNAHIHITTATVGATPTPGVISPTTSTGSPSTADIDQAKSETIEVP